MEMFTGADIPQPELPNQAPSSTNAATNAADAERIRRLKALGKQNSIFAGDLSPAFGGAKTFGG